MDKRKAIAENNKLAMQAANQGRFDEAFNRLSQAVMHSREIGAPLLVAVSKNNMGIACQMSGRFMDARTCFAIAHHTVHPLKPANHPLLKIIDRNMARLEREVLDKAA